MQTLNLILSAPAGGGFDAKILLMYGLIFVVFYFFMIRPQMKKAKDEKNFKQEVKKGDRVVTIGGIHGKIIDMDDTTMTLEIDNGVRVKCEKTAISMEATKALASAK